MSRLDSEVESRFEQAKPDSSEVIVCQRQFERHGDAAAVMHEGMVSARGWPLIMAELRRGVRRAARECPPLA